MLKTLWILLAASSLAFFSCQKTKGDQMNILVYTRTEGYRHDSIPAAVSAFQSISDAEGWKMHHTEDSLFFTKRNLASFNVAVFLHTTGNILGDSGRKTLQDFVESGGGLVTVHSGTITENDWPWFVHAVGAIFTGHPPTQKGRLVIEDRSHPAASFFPDSVWIIEDEWYSFDRNPRQDAHVLISIDESSYGVDDNRWFEGAKQRMGDHPLVWYKMIGNGRVFQTALGHPSGLYSDSLFIKHLTGAVYWTSGKKYRLKGN